MKELLKLVLVLFSCAALAQAPGKSHRVGVLVQFGMTMLDMRLRIDDPAGVIAIHGIGGLWGYDAYRPELFASTEPFLVLFVAMYMLIPILFATGGRAAKAGVSLRPTAGDGPNR